MPDNPGAGPGQTRSLQDLVQELTSISTRPEFLQMLDEIKSARNEDRVPTAMRLATLDGLRERGISVSPDFRLTTRYFEDPTAPVRGDILTSTEEPEIAAAAAPTITVCFSVGAIVCASVGTSTDLPMLPPAVDEIKK